MKKRKKKEFALVSVASEFSVKERRTFGVTQTPYSSMYD